MNTTLQHLSDAGTIGGLVALGLAYLYAAHKDIGPRVVSLPSAAITLYAALRLAQVAL